MKMFKGSVPAQNPVVGTTGCREFLAQIISGIIIVGTSAIATYVYLTEIWRIH